MKWVGLIVTVIVGGLAVYYIFFGNEPSTYTPVGTANAFVKAALANDMETVKNLCEASAVQSTQATAKQVSSMVTSAWEVSFSPMNADPPREGAIAQFKGSLLTIEFIKKGDAWKIVSINLSSI